MPLIILCASYRFNMFRALLYPSSGVRDCNFNYHIGSFRSWFAVRLQAKYMTCFSLQPGHYSNLPAPNLRPTANQGMYNFRFTVLTNTKNSSNY